MVTASLCVSRTAENQEPCLGRNPRFSLASCQLSYRHSLSPGLCEIIKISRSSCLVFSSLWPKAKHKGASIWSWLEAKCVCTSSNANSQVCLIRRNRLNLASHVRAHVFIFGLFGKAAASTLRKCRVCSNVLRCVKCRPRRKCSENFHKRLSQTTG